MVVNKFSIYLGMLAPLPKADNVGFIFIQMKILKPVIYFTGLLSLITGILAAQTAIQLTLKKTTK